MWAAFVRANNAKCLIILSLLNYPCKTKAKAWICPTHFCGIMMSLALCATLSRTVVNIWGAAKVYRVSTFFERKEEVFHDNNNISTDVDVESAAILNYSADCGSSFSWIRNAIFRCIVIITINKLTALSCQEVKCILKLRTDMVGDSLPHLGFIVPKLWKHWT